MPGAMERESMPETLVEYQLAARPPWAAFLWAPHAARRRSRRHTAWNHGRHQSSTACAMPTKNPTATVCAGLPVLQSIGASWREDSPDADLLVGGGAALERNSRSGKRIPCGDGVVDCVVAYVN